MGSFLNVCIHRFPKNLSIVFPASHCVKCNKPILWFDNIPIISYIVLGGKCRSCKEKISPRYFIVELLTGILFTILYLHYGLSVKLYIYAIFVAALIVATFVDFDIQEIPDQASLGCLGIALIASAIFPELFGVQSHLASFGWSCVGAIVGGGSILVTAYLGEFVFKREAMGGGDVRLMAMIGAFIGWKMVVLTYFLAPFFGAPIGIYLKYRQGKEIIPYGPYLSLAAIVSLLWGDRILSYLFYRPY